MHAEAKLPQFDVLVSALADTRFSIPAPIQAFHGTISMAADIASAPGRNAVAADFEVHTNLGSGAQKLITTAKAHAVVQDCFSKNPQTIVEGNIILNDVALSAPPASRDRSRRTGLPFRTALRSLRWAPDR